MKLTCPRKSVLMSWLVPSGYPTLISVPGIAWPESVRSVRETREPTLENSVAASITRTVSELTMGAAIARASFSEILAANEYKNDFFPPGKRLPRWKVAEWPSETLGEASKFILAPAGTCSRLSVTCTCFLSIRPAFSTVMLTSVPYMPEGLDAPVLAQTPVTPSGHKDSETVVVLVIFAHSFE